MKRSFLRNSNPTMVGIFLLDERKRKRERNIEIERERESERFEYVER